MQAFPLITQRANRTKETIINHIETSQNKANTRILNYLFNQKESYLHDTALHSYIKV